MRVAVVMAFLAFLVYGVFWLITQEWWDLFPRRMKRRVGAGGVVIMVMVSQLAPAAFQGGINQFAEWSQARYKNQIDTIISQSSLPARSDPPNPAMGQMRPSP